jgi:hypothetical protein
MKKFTIRIGETSQPICLISTLNRPNYFELIIRPILKLTLLLHANFFFILKLIFDTSMPSSFQDIDHMTMTITQKVIHLIMALLQLDKYELGRRLGNGTYGKVRLATDSQTRKEYAIKIIKKPPPP